MSRTNTVGGLYPLIEMVNAALLNTACIERNTFLQLFYAPCLSLLRGCVFLLLNYLELPPTTNHLLVSNKYGECGQTTTHHLHARLKEKQRTKLDGCEDISLLTASRDDSRDPWPAMRASSSCILLPKSSSVILVDSPEFCLIIIGVGLANETGAGKVMGA